MRSWFSGLVALSLVTAVVAACSGKSVESESTPGSAGIGAAGGSAGSASDATGGSTAGSTAQTGGASGSSGSGGTGGMPGSGGSSATGGTGGSGGTGGAVSMGGSGGDAGSGGSTAGTNATGGAGGAVIEDDCTLPLVSGACMAAFPRFGYDESTGGCVEFVYGGCNGNANNFETLAACVARCHPDGDITSCDTPNECVLRSAACRSPCEPAPLGSFVAVSGLRDEEFSGRLGCDMQFAGGACPPTGDPTSQWFGATCDGGRCVGFDARASSITECEMDDDCVLRNGMRCYEDCQSTPETVVAVNREADLIPLLCDPNAYQPPTCDIVYPEGAEAACVEGRCQPRFP